MNRGVKDFIKKADGFRDTMLSIGQTIYVVDLDKDHLTAEVEGNIRSRSRDVVNINVFSLFILCVVNISLIFELYMVTALGLFASAALVISSVMIYRNWAAAAKDHLESNVVVAVLTAFSVFKTKSNGVALREFAIDDIDRLYVSGLSESAKIIAIMENGTEVEIANFVKSNSANDFIRRFEELKEKRRSA